jgi:hypothetical protein
MFELLKNCARAASHLPSANVSRAPRGIVRAIRLFALYAFCMTFKHHIRKARKRRQEQISTPIENQEIKQNY